MNQEEMRPSDLAKLQIGLFNVGNAVKEENRIARTICWKPIIPQTPGSHMTATTPRHREATSYDVLATPRTPTVAITSGGVKNLLVPEEEFLRLKAIESIHGNGMTQGSGGQQAGDGGYRGGQARGHGYYGGGGQQKERGGYTGGGQRRGDI